MNSQKNMNMQKNKIELANQFFHAVYPGYGLSVDIKTHEITVDLEKICEKYRKTFEQICRDEKIINQILDTYLDMRKRYSLKT